MKKNTDKRIGSGGFFFYSGITSLLFQCILIILTSFFLIVPGFSQDDPENAAIFKKAEYYFFQNKLEMAELMLQECIKKNPENGKAYSYLGDIFLKKKNFDGALNVFKKAIDLNTDLAENYFRLGQVYYHKKNADESIDNFKRSLELDKSINFSYFHMGLTYLMLKRDKASTIRFWETYIGLAPEDPQYDKIKRAIALLKDPNFVLPPPGSEVSIEEALLLGGATADRLDRTAKDKQAGSESKKTKQKIEEIYTEDDL